MLSIRYLLCLVGNFPACKGPPLPDRQAVWHINNQFAVQAFGHFDKAPPAQQRSLVLRQSARPDAPIGTFVAYRVFKSYFATGDTVLKPHPLPEGSAKISTFESIDILQHVFALVRVVRGKIGMKRREKVLIEVVFSDFRCIRQSNLSPQLGQISLHRFTVTPATKEGQIHNYFLL